MAAVTNTVTLPNGDPAPNAVVQVRLIASTSGDAPGYEADRTILGVERVEVEDGVWSVDLEPNVNITPSNTYYEIVESAAGHAVAHTIRVTTGGPHWLGDLLISAPDSIPASQLESHAAEEEAARTAALDEKLDVVEVGVTVAPLEDDGEDGLRVPAIFLPDSATNGLPTGGTDGQILTKQSATDGDADWEDAGSGVPDGGATGQALVKQSGTDGDADWGDVATPETLNEVAATGATETLTGDDVQDLTLTANCTLTFPSATDGVPSSFTLIARQDATGARLITWPASVDWEEGAAPTLSLGAGQVDVLTFLTVDGGTVWLGFTAGFNLS